MHTASLQSRRHSTHHTSEIQFYIITQQHPKCQAWFVNDMLPLITLIFSGAKQTSPSLSPFLPFYPFFLFFYIIDFTAVLGEEQFYWYSEDLTFMNSLITAVLSPSGPLMSWRLGQPSIRIWQPLSKNEERKTHCSLKNLSKAVKLELYCNQMLAAKC